MTITWTISTTDFDVATGFIQTAHWQCTATDGDYTASVYATCSWADGTPTIPYADVTMQKVLDWCWAGKAIITLITSTEIKVNIDATQKEAP
jgi:hypothetical protein